MSAYIKIKANGRKHMMSNEYKDFYVLVPIAKIGCILVQEDLWENPSIVIASEGNKCLSESSYKTEEERDNVLNQILEVMDSFYMDYHNYVRVITNEKKEKDNG